MKRKSPFLLGRPACPEVLPWDIVFSRALTAIPALPSPAVRAPHTVPWPCAPLPPACWMLFSFRNTPSPFFIFSELCVPDYSVWLLFSEINESDSILVIRYTSSQHVFPQLFAFFSFPRKSIKFPFTTVPHCCSCAHRYWQLSSGANSYNPQCSWSDCRLLCSYTTMC